MMRITCKKACLNILKSFTTDRENILPSCTFFRGKIKLDKLGFTVFGNGVNIDYESMDRNNFIMLTLVYEEGYLSEFRNDELIQTNYEIPVTNKKISQNTIGKHTRDNNYLSSTRFSGVIDEIRIYYRSISKDEIWQLYERN